MNISHIEHLGIAVKSLDEAIPYYENILGMKCYSIEEVADQKVKTAFFKVDRPNSSSSSQLLTRALSPNSSRSAAKASITSHLPLKTVLPTLWLKWKAKACASSTKLLAKAPKV